MTALKDLSQNTPIQAAGIADRAVTTRKQFLDVQFMTGANNAYVGIPTADFLYTNGASNMLRIDYTPTVDCWWEVGYNVGIMYCLTTGTTSYAYLGVNFTGTLAFGPTVFWEIASNSSDQQPYSHRAGKRLVPLTAGVAYNATITSSLVGSWQYYQGSEWLLLYGKAWAR